MSDLAIQTPNHRVTCRRVQRDGVVHAEVEIATKYGRSAPLVDALAWLSPSDCREIATWMAKV